MRRERYQHGWLTKEKGKWLGHYNRRVLNHETGETKRLQPAFVIGKVSDLTRAQAMRKCRERVEAELGLRPDSKSTVTWFIQNRWKPLREATWRESTKGTNEGLLKVITKRFGQVPLDEMDPVEMQAWLNNLARTKSGSLVMHCRILLRSVMSEAAEQDFIRKSPARMLRVPILKPTTKTYLALGDIKRLLKTAEPFVPDRLILKVLLVTGMRPSEVFALRWKCFDEEWSALTLHETVYRGKVRPFTKTTKQGAVEHVTVIVPKHISWELAEWLYKTEHKKPDDFIFPDSEGGVIWKENWLRRTLTPIARMAGIDKINFQMFRRSVATHAQHLGSPKDISTILRHSSIETAQKNYIQAIPETVRQTAERLADLLLAGSKTTKLQKG